jgi:hypothetical protein
VEAKPSSEGGDQSHSGQETAAATPSEEDQS